MTTDVKVHRLILEPDPFRTWMRPCIGLIHDAQRGILEARRRLYGDAVASEMLARDIDNIFSKVHEIPPAPETTKTQLRLLNRLLLCPGERLFCDDILALAALNRRWQRALRATGSPRRQAELEYLNCCRELLLARRTMRQEAEKARVARLRERGGVEFLTDTDHCEIAAADLEVQRALDCYILKVEE